MKILLRILFILLPFLWSVFALAQGKKTSDCSSTCFSTHMVESRKVGEDCTAYTLSVSSDGTCAHALSHFTVAIPCGTVDALSNSQGWKQVAGLDPTTGLSGIKIDDIPEFGKGALKTFTVSFTLCRTNQECSSLLGCWNPVVAYKAGTCVNYDTVAVSCARLEAQLQQQDVSCFGAADGSVAVLIESGAAPFTFAWSTGADGQSIAGLSPGSYTVTVTDHAGESVTLDAVIQQPSEINIVGEITQATCAGNDGSIDVSVSGGAGEYTFTWGDGITSEDRGGLGAGSFELIVSDKDGCHAAKTFVVPAENPINVTYELTAPDCSGANGGIDLTVNGGAGPYTFEWSNGADSEDLQDVAAGLYTVNVRDAAGCQTSALINLKVNNPLRISYETTQSACNAATGGIDVTVTGGTEPYTFEWSNGSDLEDADGLTSGSHTVTVTDAGGCTRSATIFVAQRSFTVSAAVENPSCAGSGTGSIEIVDIAGSDGPFVFEWSNGDTGNAIDDLAAGLYTVTITDATGCSRKEYYLVSDPAAISATTSVTNTNCGAEGNYNVDLSVSGGSGPFTFVWSDGEFTEDRSSLNTGSYSVTITDAKGCSIDTDVVIVETGEGLSCFILPPDSLPVCGTESNTITTDVADADSYSWTLTSADPGWLITAGSETAVVEFTTGAPNTSGTFSLTVTKGGCSKTCVYTIASCTDDEEEEDPGGEHPGEEDPEEEPGDNDAPCDTCFGSSMTVRIEDDSCREYIITVNTTGDCRHDLSHWTVAIPCGEISGEWNSEGWPMEAGLDPTTGLTGLKVDNISGFGAVPGSFEVRFILCPAGECTTALSGWDPVVSYKAGQCVAYDTLNHIPMPPPPVGFSAYPNPFSDVINFSMAVAADEYGKLELLDQFGKVVRVVFEGQSDRGHAYNLSTPTTNLPHGLYYWRFTTGQQTMVGKIYRAP